MHLKDRHTGEGREGSGRVSAFRATGLLYSYTLECNFNTGRLVNGVPMASRDCGRATPPMQYDHPPKYDPEVYEDSGKALAISILDLTESNPWTRLTCSAHKNLRGVRDWLRKYIKAKAIEEAKNGTPTKTGSGSSPGRSNVKSTARRVRTFSLSSSAVAKKKSSPKAPPSSPESYRPVNKLPRKNSGPQQVPASPTTPTRGRSKMTTSTPVRSASTSGNGNVKRRSSASTNSVKGRSQSMILQRRPMTAASASFSGAGNRSRPTSPLQAKRPLSGSRGSAGEQTLSGLRNKIRGKAAASTSSSSGSSFDCTSAQDEPGLQAALSSPFKKKPLKRIRRRKGGSAGATTEKK